MSTTTFDGYSGYKSILLDEMNPTNSLHLLDILKNVVNVSAHSQYKIWDNHAGPRSSSI
jgi:hypothetical protein